MQEQTRLNKSNKSNKTNKTIETIKTNVLLITKTQSILTDEYYF